MIWTFQRKCRIIAKPPQHWNTHFCKKPRDGRLRAGTIVECPQCGKLWILDIVPDVLGMNKVWKRHYGE